MNGRASDGGAAQRRRRWLAVLVVLVGALWPVRDVPGFAFVDFDDPINLTLHPRLGPPSADLWQWAWSDTAYMRRYVPLGWLGFSAVYGAAGLAPWGYHTAGVVWHAGNALLVFAVFGALLRRFTPEVDAEWRTTAAVLGALGWAVHPLRAEIAGWASGLFYGQAAALALAAVWVYLRMPAAGGGRALALAVSGALHAGSLLTYPVALGLTGVLVAIDFAALRRRVTGGAATPTGATEPGWRRLAAEKLVFLLPAAAMLGVTWWARQRADGFWEAAPGAEFGAFERGRQAIEAWAHFVAAPLWPTGLTPVPTWLATAEGGSARAWASAFATVGLTLAAVAVVRRWPAVVALWGAHLALLGPLLGWSERPYFPADRYHTLAGVVWMAAVAVLLARVPGPRRRIVAVAGVAVAAVWAWGQAGQLRHWRDTDALMARIVARAEVPAVRAEYTARWVAFHANRGDAARAEALAQTLGVGRGPGGGEAKPGVPVAASVHLGLAIDARRAGRREPAREHLREALRVAPAWPEAALQAAIFFAEEGDWAEAWRWCRRLGPDAANAAVPEAARRQVAAAIAAGFRANGQERAAAGVERWVEAGR